MHMIDAVIKSRYGLAKRVDDRGVTMFYNGELVRQYTPPYAVINPDKCLGFLDWEPVNNEEEQPMPFNPKRDFWIPACKYQLVHWLTERYPEKDWNSKSKKQLMAIYINIRQRLKR